MAARVTSVGDSRPGATPARIEVDARLEQIEIDALLEAVFRHYGLDFRSYARASLTRRVRKFVESEGARTISGVQERVLHDPSALHRLLSTLTVNVTSMFRDPDFYRSFRRHVAPLLRTYPYVRIWHAGCSTGEEVYSMAILLHEEGLLDRTRIYATDIDENALDRAREGIYPLHKMKEYSRGYLAAGGCGSLSDYYTAAYEGVRLRAFLAERALFTRHNLAMDGVFAEFTVIICRNVMIYFDRTLQDRVHSLFDESLVPLGVLALGTRESLHTLRWESQYEPLDAEQRIFRRIVA